MALLGGCFLVPGTARAQETVEGVVTDATNGQALSEVTNQYGGIEPNDPAFEPYLALAEELDVPVGLHIGTGPPGAPYLGFDKYRARMHSPLALEEVLMKHPKLRIYVMHAGWPASVVLHPAAS